MKYLMLTISKLHTIQRRSLAFLHTARASFSNKHPVDFNNKLGLGIQADKHLDEKYLKIKAEEKAFFDKLSNKEKKYHIAHRL